MDLCLKLLNMNKLISTFLYWIQVNRQTFELLIKLVMNHVLNVGLQNLTLLLAVKRPGKMNIEKNENCKKARNIDPPQQMVSIFKNNFTLTIMTDQGDTLYIIFYNHESRKKQPIQFWQISTRVPSCRSQFLKEFLMCRFHPHQCLVQVGLQQLSDSPKQYAKGEVTAYIPVIMRCQTTHACTYHDVNHVCFAFCVLRFFGQAS